MQQNCQQTTPWNPSGINCMRYAFYSLSTTHYKHISQNTRNISTKCVNCQYTGCSIKINRKKTSTKWQGAQPNTRMKFLQITCCMRKCYKCQSIHSWETYIFLGIVSFVPYPKNSKIIVSSTVSSYGENSICDENTFKHSHFEITSWYASRVKVSSSIGEALCPT